MPKNPTERLFHDVADLVERLNPDEELDGQDIRENLKAAGIDPAKMRERLHEAALNLSRKQHRAGRPAPRYLNQVVEATAPVERLPNDPRKAIDKMKGWLGSLGPSAERPLRDLGVARAYRKSGEVSQDDRRQLDEIERKLKERARRGDDTKP